MEANLSEAFGSLMDSEVWIRAAAVTAGYFAPTVLRNFASGSLPDAIDHPETYGVAVMGAGQMAPKYSAELTTGGGVYTVEQLAERANIRSSIVNLGGA